VVRFRAPIASVRGESLLATHTTVCLVVIFLNRRLDEGSCPKKPSSKVPAEETKACPSAITWLSVMVSVDEYSRQKYDFMWQD